STIHQVLCFTQSDKQSRFINKGNDRPNVSIVVRACEHPLNTYIDTDFLIPPTLRCADDIPKTYLYVDNIAVGGEIMDYLNERISSSRLSSTNVPNGLVRPFNATLSQEYRTLAMAHFRSGAIRILICTDAAGMGCNLPDVDRVVQWKLPATFSNFIQRAGRAARGRGRQGLAVLLVEKSAYNTDIVSQNGMTNVSGKPERKRRGRAAKAPVPKATETASGVKRDPKEARDYARSHGAARGASTCADAAPDGLEPVLAFDSSDEGLLAFVQAVSCRRKLWAKAFDTVLGAPPSVPCCDICHPALLARTRPPPPVAKKRASQMRRGLADLAAQTRLREWRQTIFVRDHSYAQYDSSAILNEDLIASLTVCGPLSSTQLSVMLKEKWSFWERYHEELAAFVSSITIAFTPIPSKPRVPRRPPTLAAPPSDPDASKVVVPEVLHPSLPGVLATSSLPLAPRPSTLITPVRKRPHTAYASQSTPGSTSYTEAMCQDHGAKRRRLQGSDEHLVSLRSPSTSTFDGLHPEQGILPAFGNAPRLSRPSDVPPRATITSPHFQPFVQQPSRAPAQWSLLGGALPPPSASPAHHLRAHHVPSQAHMSNYSTASPSRIQVPYSPSPSMPSPSPLSYHSATSHTPAFTHHGATAGLPWPMPIPSSFDYATPYGHSNISMQSTPERETLQVPSRPASARGHHHLRLRPAPSEMHFAHSLTPLHDVRTQPPYAAAAADNAVHPPTFMSPASYRGPVLPQVQPPPPSSSSTLYNTWNTMY
ncbi:hypothetical protein C2E23DRAFT_835629, partial [Lenzites betulinus]